jgi:NADH:ubiquinone oxidoreductase subunit E
MSTALDKTENSDTAEDKAMITALDSIINELKDQKGALIPILQSAQNMFGYLSKNVLIHVSSRLNIPYSEVAGVVSFYSYFSTVPRGKYIVRVCLGTACYVRGGKEVLDSLKKSLKIDVGETTEDRLFSLEIGRCFGACGLAPVVMINDDVHQRVKPSKIRDILNHYIEGGSE